MHDVLEATDQHLVSNVMYIKNNFTRLKNSAPALIS